LAEGSGGQWHAAPCAETLANGGALGVRINGHRIAIFRVDGALYATDSLCTHAFVPLEEGLLLGHEIECPVHQARFDIRTGACTAFPARRPLRVFPVRHSGDSVEVWVPNELPLNAPPGR
jgi:nitrite reductase/ring-hydroxylating ferredoxin subunit